jgi:aminopeptidase
VTEEAYLAGAKKVNLNWISDTQNRLHFTYADEETLAATLPWEKEKLRQMTEDLPVRIYIESEDPDALAGLDPEKL